MHPAIANYIKYKIKEARDYVMNRIETGLDADQIYEQLIGNGEALAAFKQAMQYLPRRGLETSVWVHIGSIVDLHNRTRIMLRLPVTEKHPHKFWPSYAVTVTPQGDLGRFFAKQMSIAMQWERLEFVFNKFCMAKVGSAEMAFMMRWIRELVADGDWAGDTPTFVNRWYTGWKKKDLLEVERELRKINAHTTPSHFPVLTKQVSDVCKSGKALFGQYRMLEVTSGDRLPPMIALFNFQPSLDGKLASDMEEIIEQWQEDSV